MVKYNLICSLGSNAKHYGEDLGLRRFFFFKGFRSSFFAPLHMRIHFKIILEAVGVSVS